KTLTQNAESHMLSLHDALPISAERALALQPRDQVVGQRHALERRAEHELAGVEDEGPVVVDLDQLGQLLLRLLDVDERVAGVVEDRKSTRLNSSHVETAYAVFC